MAFKRGIIEDGDTWMEMIASRALTSHTYNEGIADKIASDIAGRYFPEFTKLHDKMKSLKSSFE